MQIWKDIEGYKGHYQISNYGNVRSLKKDAFLMKGGYLKGYKMLAYKKPPEKAIFRQRQFVRYVKGKEICIRVINGDIKNENQKEATRLRGNFPPFNQK